MKKLATALSAFAISAIAFGSAASAAGHVNTLDLTGSQVQQIVQDQGSVILDTGANTFDRYVANASFCLVGENAQAAYVPTADSSANFVGYTCEENTDDS